MAVSQQITSESRAEAFVVGFTIDDTPISKPVCDMSREEMLAAMAYAVEEFTAALAEVEPIKPLAEANYLPETPEASLLLIEKCFAFEQVRQRMERLAQAVAATGVH
jgi:hypothetical protein